MSRPVDGDVSSSRQACRNSRSSPAGPAARRPGAVDRVARDRVPDRLEVDADLVRAAGDEVELEQGPAGEPLADPVARRRRPAVGDDRHARPRAGSRPIGASMRPTAAATVPGDEREVGLLDPARLELRHEGRLGRVVAGDHQQAARVPVEAMDDARPLHPGDPAGASPPSPSEQRVDERAGGVAGRGWTTRPGGLVDDEQVVVLVDDRDIGISGWREARRARAAGRRARAPARLDHVVFALTGWPSAVSAAVGDEPLDVAPRQAGQVGREAVGPAARPPAGTTQPSGRTLRRCGDRRGRQRRSDAVARR